MKRNFTGMSLFGVLVFLLLSLSASAGTAVSAKSKPATPRTLVARYGKIYAFAQDGGAIAWIAGDARVRVRSLTPGRTSVVGKVDPPERTAGAVIALAGARALWAWDNGGNSSETSIASGAPGRASVGVDALEGGSRNFGDGERFTGIAGDGKTLVYGWVHEACVNAQHNVCDFCNPLGSCPLVVTAGGLTPVSGQAIRPPRPVIPGIPAPAIFALSQGRVAAAPARSPAPEGESVLRAAENGPVAVYGATGALVSRVGPQGRVEALALSSQQLAVLVEKANGAKAIERYEPLRGTFLATTSVPKATASELSISNAGIVYRVAKKIYLLGSGQPKLVWQATGTPIGLSIEGRRIAWAVNVKDRGRIVSLTVPQ
jgi:hypothetical protein